MDGEQARRESDDEQREQRFGDTGAELEADRVRHRVDHLTGDDRLGIRDRKDERKRRIGDDGRHEDEREMIAFGTSRRGSRTSSATDAAVSKPT